VNVDQTLLPPAFARYWARELGSKETSLIRLQGGINNRVYRCGDRRFWVIKGYAPLKPGLRDRMQAEVEFLQYAAQVAPGFTPGLIHVDDDQRCVVLEYLEGESFPEGSPPPESAVSCAVDFFRQLNSDHTAARQFIRQDAAEGFLSLSEHLENIQQRLAGMGCEHLPAEIKPQAERLLASMQTKYKSTYEITVNQIANGKLIDAIKPKDCCISPSDFGFHNSISTSTGVKFFDFEFSGWDDPTKTALDFILQPSVPVKQGLSPLLSSLNVKHSHFLKKRYEALMPILSLKWSCIILSVLNPLRLREIIRQSSSSNLDNVISERINSATSHLQRSSVCPNMPA
jgi:hypothetical protein